MQAADRKLGINKVWMTILSVGVVIAIVLGAVGLVNHGDTKANVIPTISQQMENIENSIPELEAVSTELKGYIDTLETTVEKLQTDLTATNTAIDTLETEAYGKNDDSEKKVLDELNALKTSIEGQIATVNSDITALKTKDAELDQKIADLQTYVDSKITATEEWASDTFATFAQYETVQTTIAGIKSDIESIKSKITALETDVETKVATINASIASLNSDLATKVANITDAYTAAIANAEDAITAAYTDAIETAIDDSETSMKAWVNEELADGYYDIAAIDAKLAALETELADADAELKNQIEDQQAALEQAKKDLTAAYGQAISDAIADGGVISEAIADAVNAAKSELQSKIDSINSEISDIKDRLTELETNFANRIQSLTFIPRYSDGKATIDYITKTAAVDLHISPANIASLIKADNVKAYIRYTEDSANRNGIGSVGDEVPLDVTSVTAGENGMLEIALAEHSDSPLSRSFWQGQVGAVIYIQITDDDGNNVVSDAIQLIVYGYVSDTDIAIEKFKYYFCNMYGSLNLYAIDSNAGIWAVCTKTGEGPVTIFNDIAGMNVTAQESYTYSFTSADGEVKLEITGTIEDDADVYATLNVTMPGYEQVKQIVIVTTSYVITHNIEFNIPVIFV